MAIYFNDFPSVDYKFHDDTVTLPVVNILRRFKPLDVVLNMVEIFYEYNVKDGERPDIVADKIYGHVEYDWILLMFNKKFDPYFDWVLFYDQFNAYLEDKYGSVEASTQQIHHYEQIIQPWQKLYDGTIIAERTLVIDQTTYEGLADEDRKLVYAYDYENALNESRRKIKVVDSIYIPQILQEKTRIFS